MPGLRDVHDLRLRRSGGALRGDGHVTFDGSLTLSEAHRLTEAAPPFRKWLTSCCTPSPRAMPTAWLPIPLHCVLRSSGVCARSSRAGPAAVQIVGLRLDYRDDGLRIDLVLSWRVSDETSLRAGLEACLEPLLPIPVSIILTGPTA